MALTKQCDRCKRYYEYYEMTDCKSPRRNGIMTVMTTRKGVCLITDNNAIDLCPDCLVSFIDWLDMKGEKENAEN